MDGRLKTVVDELISSTRNMGPRMGQERKTPGRKAKEMKIFPQATQSLPEGAGVRWV